MMSQIDPDELRARVRSMKFERGTADQIALWREDVAEARANLVLEDMTPAADDDAMFAVMLNEGVPPSLMPAIILGFYSSAVSDDLENTAGRAVVINSGPRLPGFRTRP